MVIKKLSVIACICLSAGQAHAIVWERFQNTAYTNLTATQLDNITNLFSATVPQFVFRTGAGQYRGSLLGTSQSLYMNYPGLFEVSAGTVGAVASAAGPVVKISRTGTPILANCVNIPDSECDASLAVYAIGTATGAIQTTALFAGAQGGSTTTGVDQVGLWAGGRVTGSGVGVGTGAYLEGRRDTTTGLLVGAEVRGANITGSDCFFNDAGFGTCDGLWITAQGNGTAHLLSSAVHIDTADNSKWNSAITIDPNGAATYAIHDKSTATVGINEDGTHTYGLLLGTNAGKAGIGTLTPTYKLDVVGQARVTQAYLNSSSVPAISACGTSPPAATAGSSNNAGEFTLGTGTPTACTVTFANAYPTDSFCTVTPTTSYTGTYYVSANTAAAFTVTLGTGTSSVKFNYTCFGA